MRAMTYRVANVVAETGLRAEWRHNREGVMSKPAIAGACVAAFLLYRSAARPRLHRPSAGLGAAWRGLPAAERVPR